jgi:glycerol-3-phosphate O-acyltransferase/dihydroxyacetone phosphate acyltransferase
MLYRILHFIFRYAVKKYFRKIRIQNAELIPKDKPVVFFPNHRSAFMDPLVVATMIDRPMHFLARGESFKNPIMAKIYRQLNMIPIYRKEFSPDEAHKNKDVFRNCDALLEKNGAIMIFPEGLSQTKPRLLPFKTGMARIVLGAEEKNDFNLDVQLIPVGINYTNPHRFQSDLFINMGEPIPVSKYKEMYEGNSFDAVKQLTADTEAALKERIITLDGKRWFKLSEKVEAIVESEPEGFLSKTNEAGFDWYLAKKDINGAIDYFKTNKPDLLNHLEKKTNDYMNMLQRLKVSKDSINVNKDKYSLKHNFPLLVLYLIVLSPLFLVGLIFLGIPFIITRLIANAVVKRVDFMGSVVLFIGLVIFTLFGAVESVLVAKYTGFWLWGVAVFLLLPLLGMATRKYYMHLIHLTINRRWLSISARKNKLADYVVNEKQNLLGLFKEAYREYLMEKGK